MLWYLPEYTRARRTAVWWWRAWLTTWLGRVWELVFCAILLFSKLYPCWTQMVWSTVTRGAIWLELIWTGFGLSPTKNFTQRFGIQNSYSSSSKKNESFFSIVICMDTLERRTCLCMETAIRATLAIERKFSPTYWKKPPKLSTLMTAHLLFKSQRSQQLELSVGVSFRLLTVLRWNAPSVVVTLASTRTSTSILICSKASVPSFVRH